MTTSSENLTPSPLAMESKGNSRSSSIPRILSTRLGPSFSGSNTKMGEFRSMSNKFQELLLEIPSMEKQDVLFCFLYGLRGCTKMEVERCGAQDLASAIAAVEFLIEFKREFSKGRGKKTHKDGNGEGDKDNSPKRDPSPRDKGNGEKDEAPNNYSYFLCNEPHWL